MLCIVLLLFATTLLWSSLKVVLKVAAFGLNASFWLGAPLLDRLVNISVTFM